MLTTGNTITAVRVQVYAGKSAGFDPEETRFFRKGSAASTAAGNLKDFVVPYVPSESGCG